MSEHTAGPWEWTRELHTLDLVIYGPPPHEHLVAIAHVSNPALPDEVCTANARLIAAAPDLLAACESVLRDYEGTTDDDGALHLRLDVARLRAAIQKARGT